MAADGGEQFPLLERSRKRDTRDSGKDGGGESGQSMLEFLLVLPLIITLVVMMIRVTTVIQVSIAHQKYARAQALFLAYNSPYYPERRFHGDMIRLGTNQVLVGVSNKPAPLEENEKYDPDPVIYKITRPGGLTGNDSDPEADRRHRVRVRTTVALCAPPVVVLVNGEAKPYSPATLSDTVTFPFCKPQFEPGALQ